VPNEQDYHALSCLTLKEKLPGCHGQLLARLEWLGSALEMRGIGKGTWKKLIDANLVTGLIDWLYLDNQALTAVSGIGDVTANHLLDAFAKAKKQPIADWLEALGAPSGSQQRQGGWSDLAALNAAQWQELPGIGPVRSSEITAFFNHPEIRQIASELNKAGVAIK